MKKDSSGFVTIEFVAGCCLVLIPVTLLLFLIPTWLEHQTVARTAAREAARTYVVSTQFERASAIASEIADNGGLGDDFRLELNGEPTKRNSKVTATVHYSIPITPIPILRRGGGSIQLDESHSEIADTYRSFPEQK